MARAGQPVDLTGQTFYAQGAVIDPAAAEGFALTAGLALVLG